MSNITQNLKSDSNLVEITENLNISDPVVKAIKSMKYHQNKRDDEFSFSFVTKETILIELRKLNPK